MAPAEARRRERHGSGPHDSGPGQDPARGSTGPGSAPPAPAAAAAPASPLPGPAAPAPGCRRAVVQGTTAVVEDPALAAELEERGSFGWPTDGGSLELTLAEALFLAERGRIELEDASGGPLDAGSFTAHASAAETDFVLRYRVFRDLRLRGYVVKSGLKYGCHFRVYDRGVRPRKGQRSLQEHAKFLVHALGEGYQCSVPELTRLVRLAHSVKKRIWMGVVDSEGDVTYLQVIRVTP